MKAIQKELGEGRTSSSASTTSCAQKIEAAA